jgi:hypothetical protein
MNNDFPKIFNERCDALINDLPNITVEECRERYQKLWDGCPIELHIDAFGTIKKIEEHFPDFHIEGVTIKRYDIPVLDLKLETKEVKGGVIYVPWMIIETPYMTLSDKDGTRKIWTKNKWKIVLYYLYKVTRIKWIIKKYNKIPR